MIPCSLAADPGMTSVTATPAPFGLSLNPKPSGPGPNVYQNAFGSGGRSGRFSAAATSLEVDLSFLCLALCFRVDLLPSPSAELPVDAPTAAESTDAFEFAVLEAARDGSI